MKELHSFGLAALAMLMIAGGGAGARRGPWMVAPLLSSTPKLGTSLGLVGGALHYFDERSRVSMSGLSAQSTSTDSPKASLTA